MKVKHLEKEGELIITDDYVFFTPAPPTPFKDQIRLDRPLSVWILGSENDNAIVVKAEKELSPEVFERKTLTFYPC